MLYTMNGRVFVLACLLLAAQGLCGPNALGQELYKYKDEQGNWVFSDRKPDDVEDVERQILANQTVAPIVALKRKDYDDHSELIAVNTYFAPVEIGARFVELSNVRGDVPESFRAVLGPGTEQSVVDIWPSNAGQPWDFVLESFYIPGDPEAAHQPEHPYRVPFATATAHKVTQAYPDQHTHNTKSSFYAVDISMPIGTNIFAARGGTVIDIATHFFSSGTDIRKDGNRANIVRILHADGTMAIYAHLNWDSIRVRPGDKVRRGEYIADSGNTGFSTGPHLHFAVQKNTGLELESLKFRFGGERSAGNTPRSGQKLTAR